MVTVLKRQRQPDPFSLGNHTVAVEGVGPSDPFITYFLLPMYPISYPHPIRPISMFPLLLANLHNYSLPFSWNQIMVMILLK